MVGDVWYHSTVERVVIRRRLGDDETQENLRYWLSRTPQDRLAEVERLRRQMYGTIPRLERIVAVVPLARR